MIISVNARYKLKKGAFPSLGRAHYGTDSLMVLAFDSDDLTVQVRPEGFSSSAEFWAFIDDLIEEE